MDRGYELKRPAVFNILNWTKKTAIGPSPSAVKSLCKECIVPQPYRSSLKMAIASSIVQDESNCDTISRRSVSWSWIRRKSRPVHAMHNHALPVLGMTSHSTAKPTFRKDASTAAIRGSSTVTLFPTYLLSMACTLMGPYSSWVMKEPLDCKDP